MNDIKQHKYYYRSWQKIIDDQRRYNEQYKSNGECMKCIEWTGSRLANQQATANHTAKMFNQNRHKFSFRIRLPNTYAVSQSRTQWLASDGNPVNEPKEIKMTRKEAIEKIQELFESEWTLRQMNDYIDGLEALGLIKFDEEKSVVDEAKEYVRNYTLYDRQELAGVIDMLIRHIEK